jgi:hypothetical protein
MGEMAAENLYGKPSTPLRYVGRGRRSTTFIRTLFCFHILFHQNRLDRLISHKGHFLIQKSISDIWLGHYFVSGAFLLDVLAESRYGHSCHAIHIFYYTNTIRESELLSSTSRPSSRRKSPPSMTLSDQSCSRSHPPACLLQG